MAGEWGMGTPAEIAAYQAICEHFWVYTKGGRICLDCKKCEDNERQDDER